MAHDGRLACYARAVLTICMITVMSGCSGVPAAGIRGDDALSDSELQERLGQLDASRFVEADVRVEVTGAEQFRWEGTELLQVVDIDATEASMSLLTVGFLQFVPYDGAQHRFRFAVDLLNTYERRPGTFAITGQPATISAGGTNAPAGGLESSALLYVIRVKDDAGVATATWDDIETSLLYDQVAKPCTLVVGPGVAEGSLECPELRSEDGRVVALRVFWVGTGVVKVDEE